jgi:hypothetical protein
MFEVKVASNEKSLYTFRLTSLGMMLQWLPVLDLKLSPEPVEMVCEVMSNLEIKWFYLEVTLDTFLYLFLVDLDLRLFKISLKIAFVK